MKLEAAEYKAVTCFAIAIGIAVLTMMVFGNATQEPSRFTAPPVSSWGHQPIYGSDASPFEILKAAKAILVSAEPASDVSPATGRRIQYRRTVTSVGIGNVVSLFIAYAEGGNSLQLSNGEKVYLSVRLSGISASTDGIDLTTILEWAGSQPDTIHRTLPYPSEDLRSLCRGEWTSFDNLQIRLDPAQLMPVGRKHESSGVVYEWASPPEFRFKMWWFRTWSFGLKSIHITETEGRFSVTGIPDWMLPVLVWNK